MEKLNNLKKIKKDKHLVISSANYEKLRNFGRVGDTFDDVLTKILQNDKLFMLESTALQVSTPRAVDH